MNAFKSKGDKIFDILNYTFFILLSFVMIYPIWHQVCLSFSDSNLAKSGGFFFLPRGFDLSGYEAVFSSRYIWPAFFNSVFITVTGVVLALLVNSMFGYFLSKVEVPGSSVLMKLVLFSFLFSGGMIPTFLAVKYTGLLDSLWALVIPVIYVPYHIFILRNYFKGLPKALEESAFIDGAGFFTIFFRIVLPLSKPVLATVAIWVAVSQWNNYMGGLLYITDKTKYILPLLVRDIVLGASDLATTEMSAVTNSEIINAATIVIATLPILIVYPFMQKHFTKGVTVGAVKE